jgi:membrane-associated protein
MLEFLASASYLGLFAFVLLETGLLVGVFLAGDSTYVLLGAGALAAQGKLELLPVLAVLSSAAVLGHMLAFFIGKFFGNTLIRRLRCKAARVRSEPSRKA